MRTPPRLLPALVTPFNAREEIDLAAHDHNLRLLSDRGISGFVIGGSNGEGPYLEGGERVALLRTARSALGRRPFLMCGITGETLRTSLRQVEEASEGGADALLVLTPTALVRNRIGMVTRYFKDLARRSPLPVFIYSVPGTTGFSVPEEAVVELATTDNIVGMKDSQGDPVRIQRMMSALPEDFIMFNGASRSLTLAMAAGAHGGITGSTNYAAGLVLEVVRSAVRSAHRAMPLQHRLTEISSTIEAYGVPGVKAASAGVGLQPGRSRLPLRSVPRRTAEKLATVAAGI